MTIISSLGQWARLLKRDVVALWLAARDPAVPWYAKAVAGAVAAYALSPLDLIPDFIPVIGYLDDLIIVPLGILLAVRLIPEETMARLRAEATERARPQSRAGLLAIVALWLVAVAALVRAFWPQPPGCSPARTGER
ncbi:MAG: YkvA family protein [Pararhizobium sp.]